ncbi:ESX secretion-associated protein EspG [Nocardia vinacea]|uniref:ESX secretion-associated protein EspG n=1 Tax=Nocardia vinacea TaxID=96468 RepID=A0ABZ1YYB6_9NOCA|nr:ESX secretion-associated protein EspG [Nocardia vinacea]
MNRFWDFTDLEFVVLWEEMREAGLPEPFVFTSRTRFYDEAQRAKQETRERLRATLDSSFDEVLPIVAQPDIRIVVRSWDPADPKDPDGWIRLHAARRDHRAYLLSQRPGETVEHSGGFSVAECGVLEMAETVVAALPAAEAGRRSAVVFPTDVHDDGVDHEYGNSWVREPGHDPVLSRAQEFLRAPVTRLGLVQIEQGRSRFGPQGIVRRALLLRDLADDGRYLLTPGNPPQAMGAGAQRITEALNTEIAIIVRAIKDERNGRRTAV